MSDQACYDIFIHGPEDRLDDLATNGVSARMETCIDVRGISHFFKHVGWGWISIDRWEFWRDPRQSDFYQNGHYEKHYADLFRIAEKLEIADEIRRRHEADGQPLPMLYLNGVTGGNYPVDIAVELSLIYPDLLFDVHGDRLGISEGWWVIFGGRDYCLSYDGEMLVIDGQLVVGSESQSSD